MVLYAPFWCSRCASVHVCVHVRYLCFGVPNLSLALVRVANCKGEGPATSTTRAGGRGRAYVGVRARRATPPPYKAVRLYCACVFYFNQRYLLSFAQTFVHDP